MEGARKSKRCFLRERLAALDGKRGYDGIAYGVPENHGDLVAVTISCCCDPAGVLAPESQEIVARLGSYTERSTVPISGVTILVRGSLTSSQPSRKAACGTGTLEVLTTGFAFITGHALDDHLDIRENQTGLDWLIATYFDRRERPQHESGHMRRGTRAGRRFRPSRFESVLDRPDLHRWYKEHLSPLLQTADTRTPARSTIPSRARRRG